MPYGYVNNCLFKRGERAVTDRPFFTWRLAAFGGVWAAFGWRLAASGGVWAAFGGVWAAFGGRWHLRRYSGGVKPLVSDALHRGCLG